MSDQRESPWDMSPANEQQKRYLAALVERLHTEADWSTMDTTIASGCIDKLNAVRKAAGLGFAPMDGMDTTRLASPQRRT